MVFHKINFYSTTLTTIARTDAFQRPLPLDPYIRKFVSLLGHSHHEYFIDPRPIGNTIHLWTAFVIIFIILRLLSADFTELQTSEYHQMPVGTLG